MLMKTLSKGKFDPFQNFVKLLLVNKDVALVGCFEGEGGSPPLLSANR